jgi:hypothetical protein
MDGTAVWAGEEAASAPARQKYKPLTLAASNENISAGAEKKSQETSQAARREAVNSPRYLPTEPLG